MDFPIAAERYQGLPHYAQQRYVAGGTSPRTETFQLPEFGTYLIDVHAWAGNPQLAIEATFLVRWWELGWVGPSASTLAKSDRLGTVGLSNNGSNTMTDLTAAAPDANGLVTFTLAWSDTGTSRTPEFYMRALMLRNGQPQ